MQYPALIPIHRHWTVRGNHLLEGHYECYTSWLDPCHSVSYGFHTSSMTAFQPELETRAFSFDLFYSRMWKSARPASSASTTDSPLCSPLDVSRPADAFGYGSHIPFS